MATHYPAGAWRILLVDDDAEDFLLARSMLNQAQGRTVTLEWANTYESGMQKLMSGRFDAVLVDYDLGLYTGTRFIGECVSQGYPAPFILFTGRGSYEIDMEAMQAGATLYLTKSESNPLLLERAIRYAIERKDSERALRESEGRYRMLFNTMQDGFALHEIILDPDGKPVDYRFLEVNPAFEQLTGLSAAQVLGKTVLEVLPQTEPYWIDTYGQVALSGKPVRFENHSGELEKSFEVVAFSPRPNQFATIFTDISERKQMEAALRESEQQYRSLFHNHHTVMLLIDPQDGCILDANPAASHFYGYTQHELLQMKISDINTLTLEEVNAEMQRAAAEKRNHFLFHHRLKNGQERPVEVYSGPITIAGRKLLYSIIYDVTERREQERQVIEISRFPAENPNPVLRIALDGTLLYANKASALPMSVWQCAVGGPVPGEWQSYVRQAAESNTTLEVQCDWDGRTFLNALQPFPEEGYVNIYGMDVTPLREAEQALASHLQRLNSLIEISIQILGEQTEAGLYQKIVDGALELTDARIGVLGHSFEAGQMNIGYTAHSPEMPNCPPVENFTYAQGGVYQDTLKQTAMRLEEGALQNHPHWRGLPEGHVPLSGLLGSRLVNQQGQGIGAIMLSHKREGEFTPQDEAMLVQLSALGSLSIQNFSAHREAVHRADELDAVINSMTDCVLIYDANGALIRANPAAIAALGFDPLGESSMDIIARIGLKHMDSHPVLLKDLPSNRAREGQMVRNERHIFTGAGGQERTILVSSAPVRVNNVSKGSVVVFRDVTEWESAQVALRAYADRLEQANQELEDFVFIASHDLQEPLRKIQSFSERLESLYAPELPTSAKDYLDRISNASMRMQKMIADLLALSRVSTQANPFILVDLNEVSAQALSDLEIRRERTGGQVSIGALPSVMADPQQMYQLFQNLIGNALKFTQPGTHPVVSVTGRLVAPGDDGGPRMAEIRVQDNGIGFDPQNLERIFQPFQRLHGMSQYEGTGIGLSICRKIVERHNGHITAESVPGEGATFIVTLPVKQII